MKKMLLALLVIPGMALAMNNNNDDVEIIDNAVSIEQVQEYMRNRQLFNETKAKNTSGALSCMALMLSCCCVGNGDSSWLKGLGLISSAGSIVAFAQSGAPAYIPKAHALRNTNNQFLRSIANPNTNLDAIDDEGKSVYQYLTTNLANDTMVKKALAERYKPSPAIDF